MAYIWDQVSELEKKIKEIELLRTTIRNHIGVEREKQIFEIASENVKQSIESDKNDWR
jgi:hypothetical protein